jgi:spermidine synthase
VPVSSRFEVLDARRTELGVVSLRRRWDAVVGATVFEVKLDDEFLMSSTFTQAEVALAELALGDLESDALDVLVGGLGLGYTAQAVLDDPRVRSMLVVEALGPVIEWHERRLVPSSVSAASDPRCRLVRGDFFAGVAAGALDPVSPGRRFDAVVVDIDHSPHDVLHPGHAAFYTVPGTTQVLESLRPGGVFALWSNDPPDARYLEVLSTVFARARSEVVRFANPLQGGHSTNTVYLAGA